MDVTLEEKVLLEFVKDFLIGDVVGEAIVCVALDFDADDVLDCRFVEAPYNAKLPNESAPNYRKV